MDQNKFVKVFSDIAVILGLVPNNMVDNIKKLVDYDLNKDADLSNIKFSTLYLMQHIEEGCQAKCAFCAQSSDSTLAKRKSTLVDNSLMRFPISILAEKMKQGILEEKGVARICVQTIYNDKTADNLLSLVKSLRAATNIPITACCIPLPKNVFTELKQAGVDIVAINYETATQELFSNIRGENCGGPYRWHITTASINDALEVFGKKKVGSHLQIGLGETPKEALKHIQDLSDKTVFVSLFAFQPVQGTRLADRKRIPHKEFHKIQLGSYLIQNNIKRFEDFKFDDDGKIVDYGMSDEKLADFINSGTPFMNKGCPGCNRVYYETKEGQRFYTYPRPLTADERDLIKSEIQG